MAFYGSGLDQQFIRVTSVTGTNVSTADTLLTLNKNRLLLMAITDFDAPVVLTFNGADLAYLPPNQNIAIDLKKYDKSMRAGSVVGVYKTGASPVGSLAVTLV